MDRAAVPVPNRGSSQKRDFHGGHKESEENDSDLNNEDPQCSSVRSSNWGSLPDVVLRNVFWFLPDSDRKSADLVCHHWHHAMRSPSLWRYRSFYLSGGLSRSRRSESCSAVSYVRSLGVYLQRLEVCVCPPRRAWAARRLERAIRELFAELTRVRPPLQSLCLTKLELDRTAWSSELRNSVVKSLICFLRRGSPKLTSVCLSGMQNSMSHGLDLLCALVRSQRRFLPRRYISSLDLRGFFSNVLHVHLDLSMPSTMHKLPGLTNLSLSYSCLSDQLLTALLHRHQSQWGHSSRDGTTLQTLSLHCPVNESHRQLVSGDSWATLASGCPDLKVCLRVDQVISTNRLARILLPEIPLTEFSMTAFYSPDEDWSIKPVLCDMLPQYRRSLQYLTLDLSNCSESLDEELLWLVERCECLKQLRVWAFLDIGTVGGLLHIRLTQRNSLNKIKVRIYTVSEYISEEEDQLGQILSSYQRLPLELEFYAMIYPYVDH